MEPSCLSDKTKSYGKPIALYNTLFDNNWVPIGWSAFTFEKNLFDYFEINYILIWKKKRTKNESNRGQEWVIRTCMSQIKYNATILWMKKFFFLNIDETNQKFKFSVLEAKWQQYFRYLIWSLQYSQAKHEFHICKKFLFPREILLNAIKIEWIRNSMGICVGL